MARSVARIGSLRCPASVGRRHLSHDVVVLYRQRERLIYKDGEELVSSRMSDVAFLLALP